MKQATDPDWLQRLAGEVDRLALELQSLEQQIQADVADVAGLDGVERIVEETSRWRARLQQVVDEASQLRYLLQREGPWRWN
ncbi:MAG: hypothetical protein HY332_25790 [Chloroflexi bacterium]|nr:hypothetical protein [Chloroflexota bacterium]